MCRTSSSPSTRLRSRISPLAPLLRTAFAAVPYFCALHRMQHRRMRCAAFLSQGCSGSCPWPFLCSSHRGGMVERCNAFGKYDVGNVRVQSSGFRYGERRTGSFAFPMMPLLRCKAVIERRSAPADASLSSKTQRRTMADAVYSDDRCSALRCHMHRTA